MLQPQSRNRLIMFVASLIALVIVAATFPTMTFESGEPFTLPGLPTPSQAMGGEENGRYISLLVGVFWVGLIFSILYILISPEGRKMLLRLLPIMFLLLGLMQLFGNRKLKPSGQQIQGQRPTPIGIPEPTTPYTPEFIADPPNWILLIANITLGLLLLGAMWIAWRWYCRQQDNEGIH